VIARRNRIMKDLSIPDYIRLNWQPLPKEGRRYKVTRAQAHKFFERHVRPMPKDWYMHRDAKGHWKREPPLPQKRMGKGKEAATGTAPIAG